MLLSKKLTDKKYTALIMYQWNPASLQSFVKFTRSRDGIIAHYREANVIALCKAAILLKQALVKTDDARINSLAFFIEAIRAEGKEVAALMEKCGF